MVTIDTAQLLQALAALATLANTVLLVLNHRQVSDVKAAANGSQAAAVRAADIAGYYRGAEQVAPPPNVVTP